MSTYSLIPNKTSINEGEISEVKIFTTDVPNGTRVYWSASGTNITSADTSGSLTGAINISGSTPVAFAYPITADLVTEGDETLVISLHRF